MTKNNRLAQILEEQFVDQLTSVSIAYDEVTVECDVGFIKSLLIQLNSHELFAFDILIDLCAVDYLNYGNYDWKTEIASESGFSRGVNAGALQEVKHDNSRFAVVYHLLSTRLNHRLRVKVFLDEASLVLPSVHEIWKGANWFEREAYDLYGILFDGHPDLRRILTDYGFIGHPFRKDFPLSGHVEMRYDAKLEKVIYEPVDITPRTLVPKVIRNDNRYHDFHEGEK
ncbi:MAG: NADH-quinone oxidoreductase subunit C [Legionella sp.]